MAAILHRLGYIEMGWGRGWLITSTRFAHGRSIRNAVERARLRQASRLFDANRRLTRRDLLTIEPDDIRQSSVFDDIHEEDHEEGAGHKKKEVQAN